MLKGGKGYTIADIEALPEGERAELIDGELFRMDAPSWTHQEILTQLVIEISLYIRKKKGKCRVMPAPFAVYLNKDYVEPDISVICDEEKKSEKDQALPRGGRQRVLDRGCGDGDGHGV